MTKRRKHIVIVGGNFAGLTAAIKLSRRQAVTVIDPSRHFEWAPGIHEILSSVKTPQGLRLDRAAIVKQAGHRFLRDRVTVLQPAQGRLATAGGHELEFDACIVAVGALWNTHHVPGVARHAMPFRSVADGLAIEHRLDTLVQQGQPLRIVIAGGGLSGIEALGEILRRHRDDAGLSVELVEAGARLLPGLPASLDADLRRLCEPYAVKFRTAHDDRQRVGQGRAPGRRYAAALRAHAVDGRAGTAGAVARVGPGAATPGLGGRAPHAAESALRQRLRRRRRGAAAAGRRQAGLQRHRHGCARRGQCHALPRPGAHSSPSSRRPSRC